MWHCFNCRKIRNMTARMFSTITCTHCFCYKPNLYEKLLKIFKVKSRGKEDNFHSKSRCTVPEFALKPQLKMTIFLARPGPALFGVGIGTNFFKNSGTRPSTGINFPSRFKNGPETRMSIFPLAYPRLSGSNPISIWIII